MGVVVRRLLLLQQDLLLLLLLQIYPTCTEMLIAFTEFAELVQDTGKECYTTRERP